MDENLDKRPNSCRNHPFYTAVDNQRNKSKKKRRAKAGCQKYRPVQRWPFESKPIDFARAKIGDWQFRPWWAFYKATDESKPNTIRAYWSIVATSIPPTLWSSNKTNVRSRCVRNRVRKKTSEQHVLVFRENDFASSTTCQSCHP